MAIKCRLKLLLGEKFISDTSAKSIYSKVDRWNIHPYSPVFFFYQNEVVQCIEKVQWTNTRIELYKIAMGRESDNKPFSVCKANAPHPETNYQVLLIIYSSVHKEHISGFATLRQ